jgi:threonine aldolase
MIDFRSDTVTRPTPAMREAMARAEVGDDVFGDDPTVNHLQAHAAQQLGFEAALFLPTGTQANLVALLAHCGRGDEAICGQQQHLYRWEAGGMAVLGSIQPQPLENLADGSLDLAAVEAAIKPDDPHHARTRLICAENTLGGKVLPMAYLRDLRTLADRYGLATHLDGARLFNAAVAVADARAAAAGRPARAAPDAPIAVAREIGSHFDSVSVCLSKGLGAPLGSLLLGAGDFIARARRHRKMLGGGMRQAGVVAAAGLHALAHHVDRLAEDHANARRLATGLGEVAARHAGLAVQPAQTNMIFVQVDPALAPDFHAHLEAAGIACITHYGRGPSPVQRWVTHLDVGAADVDAAVAAVDAFFSRQPGRSAA